MDVSNKCLSKSLLDYRAYTPLPFNTSQGSPCWEQQQCRLSAPHLPTSSGLNRNKQEDSRATGKASRSSVANVIVLSVVSIFLHYRTGLALTVLKGLAQSVSLVLRAAKGRGRQNWTGFQPSLSLTQAALSIFLCWCDWNVAICVVPYLHSDWLGHNSCNNRGKLHHWQDADSFEMANDGMENNEIWEDLKFLSSMHQAIKNC